MKTNYHPCRVVLFLITLLGVFNTYLYTQEVERSGGAIYTGEDIHAIPLDEARVLTLRLQNNAPPGAVVAGFFGKDALLNILSNDKVVGIRCYFAQKDLDKLPVHKAACVVIVGVDSAGRDHTEGVILENWVPCPPHCSERDDLYKPRK